MIDKISRRRFLSAAGSAAGLSVVSACATQTSQRTMTAPELSSTSELPDDSFDPWVEVIRDGFQNNVREVSRLAAGRPILAVVKNNAYGLGDRTVGPLLANMGEVGGIACVRVEEALVMRGVGVTKPIVVMAEGSEEEIEELVRHDVVPQLLKVLGLVCRYPPLILLLKPNPDPRDSQHDVLHLK